MRKYLLLILTAVFVLHSGSRTYSYDTYKKSQDNRDTTDIKNTVEEKLRDLEELINEEILVSELYNGEYHSILKKAIDLVSQCKENIEKNEYDMALKKIEMSQELADRVWNLVNKESNDIRDRVINRVQQLEKLAEYSNSLNLDSINTKLKELLQQGNKLSKQARAEKDRGEYVSALETINFATDSILGMMRLGINELSSEIDRIMKENISRLNDVIKDGIDIVPQSGDKRSEWCFSQTLRYLDMAEKSIREKKFSLAHEMLYLGIGYGNMALRTVKDKVDDSVLKIPGKFEQKRIEEFESQFSRESKLLIIYENLLKMRERLSYEDNLIEQATKAVNGKKDYILKARLDHLLYFRQKAEVASLLENQSLLSTFQFLIAKFSYNILELSKTRLVKVNNVK